MAVHMGYFPSTQPASNLLKNKLKWLSIHWTILLHVTWSRSFWNPCHNVFLWWTFLSKLSAKNYPETCLKPPVLEKMPETLVGIGSWKSSRNPWTRGTGSSPNSPRTQAPFSKNGSPSAVWEAKVSKTCRKLSAFKLLFETNNGTLGRWALSRSL